MPALIAMPEHDADTLCIVPKTLTGGTFPAYAALSGRYDAPKSLFAYGKSSSTVRNHGVSHHQNTAVPLVSVRHHPSRRYRYKIKQWQTAHSFNQLI